MVTLFGRPLRCLSWQFGRPRLNSATQYFIVVNEGADSPEKNLAGFHIGWTETFQMKVLYHITMTNFPYVYKFTENVYYW